jgi:hypothetical protein
MKNLVYKELKLVILPGFYLFMLTGILILFPNYPGVVSHFYALFAVQTIFQTAKVNKDLEFASMLPIPRKSIVLARHFTVAFFQTAFLAATVPFALISSLVISPGGNYVGMDANFAFFGFAFIGYSVYNLIMLPLFFKSGSKLGVPVCLGLLGYVVTAVTLEVLAAVVPALTTNLDSLAPSTFGYQLAVLFTGIAVYVGTLFASYKLSVKNFEKVSL